MSRSISLAGIVIAVATASATWAASRDGKHSSQANTTVATGLLGHVRQNAAIEAARERDLYFPILAHGDSARKEIALTFDDGPHPAWTPKLLDLLRSLHVKATFFVVGKMVDAHPELALLEAADGHELASHTYSHRNLAKLPRAAVEKELVDGAEAIRRAVGYAPVFFRPPGGQYNQETLRIAAELHLTPVLWSANSKDFAHPTPVVVEQRLLASPASGGILLCHDGIPETMTVLPDMVRKLRDEGFSFVTVSELATHLKESRR